MHFRAWPKVDLHLHMEGALRPALLLRLAERNRIKLPFNHPSDYARFCHFRSFQDFATSLVMGASCLRTPEDFQDTIIDMGDAMAEDGIRYAEITWTPQLYLNRGYPLDTIFAAMNAGRQQAKRSHGVDMRWIVDLIRSRPGPAPQIVSWAVSDAARNGGIVALGLGGPEAGYPACNFKGIFRHARLHGLPANPHAGEGMGANSIRETLANLHPRRIGHGVRASEDEALMKELASRHIPLEICITSNIKLGLYPSYAKHPVKKLIDAGCNIILNTDDPVLFQTTLSEEYLHAIEACGLTTAEVKKSTFSAIQSSYLTLQERQSLVEEFQRCHELLEAQATEAR